MSNVKIKPNIVFFMKEMMIDELNKFHIKNSSIKKNNNDEFDTKTQIRINMRLL
jgi:hypothetical protein